MTKKSIAIFAGLAFILTLFMPIAPASADLTVAPLRVAFKGRERSAVVSLINTAPYVNTYRLGWAMYKLNEKGQYMTVPLDEKDPFGVNNMVLFSPKQVTINPGAHQLVRLSLRRPANLPPGEYRAHLTFTRLPPDKRRKNKDDDTPVKGQSVSINVNLSFSIPVLVQNGDDNTRVVLAYPQFEMKMNNGKPEPTLKLQIRRETGTYSAYGTILVYWQEEGKKERQIGILNNVAFYPELNKRDVHIMLSEGNLSNGKIRVIYMGKFESKGKIWDEKIFPVGG